MSDLVYTLQSSKREPFPDSDGLDVLRANFALLKFDDAVPDSDVGSDLEYRSEDEADKKPLVRDHSVAITPRPPGGYVDSAQKKLSSTDRGRAAKRLSFETPSKQASTVRDQGSVQQHRQAALASSRGRASSIRRPETPEISINDDWKHLLKPPGSPTQPHSQDHDDLHDLYQPQVVPPPPIIPPPQFNTIPQAIPATSQIHFPAGATHAAAPVRDGYMPSFPAAQAIPNQTVPNLTYGAAPAHAYDYGRVPPIRRDVPSYTQQVPGPNQRYDQFNGVFSSPQPLPSHYPYATIQPGASHQMEFTAPFPPGATYASTFNPTSIKACFNLFPTLRCVTHYHSRKSRSTRSQSTVLPFRIEHRFKIFPGEQEGSTNGTTWFESSSSSTLSQVPHEHVLELLALIGKLQVPLGAVYLHRVQGTELIQYWLYTPFAPSTPSREVNTVELPRGWVSITEYCPGPGKTRIAHPDSEENRVLNIRAKGEPSWWQGPGAIRFD
ncbi:hypothetical protein BDN72DRAFT_897951 [Pluteus cervinus]|uniref:Uncharacterized protein n=1 Tax=Pluteus cervinus TaxID=181527 RepID=A0ACD3ARN8_9AGAR|nr:hypothetical protein BDN72DRAFT_897951 [Pluteus cervinus]